MFSIGTREGENGLNETHTADNCGFQTARYLHSADAMIIYREHVSRIAVYNILLSSNEPLPWR